MGEYLIFVFEFIISLVCPLSKKKPKKGFGGLISVALLTVFNLTGLRGQCQTWEIGGTIGSSGYMGDFNPNNPFKFTDLAAGAFVKRNFNPYLSLKIAYTHGTIRGADSTSNIADYRNRNLSFFTTLNELSLIGEFNFIKYQPEVGRNKFTPFIFLGLAAVNYDPKAYYKGLLYHLRAYTTEGQQPYTTVALSFPYGAGLKYNFSGKWNFIVDLGYRNPNTPYLDDAGGYYPNKNTLPNEVSRALSDRSGETTGIYTGTAGTQRGNLRNYDTYMFLGFTISYTFVTSKCYY